MAADRPHSSHSNSNIFFQGGPPKGYILVAEDNPDNQLVAKYILNSLGYEVDLVETGRQAIESLGQKRYDIVLMDCQMPEMDGFEATHQIRKDEEGQNRHIPIIAMTAYALKGDREKCIESGMDDYISKPVTIDVLVEKMNKLLRDDHEKPSRSSGETVSDPESSLDMSVLAELVAVQDENGTGLVDELATIFLTDSPNRMEAIRQAVEADDSAALEHSAHALKGSCTIIGANTMRDICYELEKMGSQSQFGGSTETFSRLEDEFAQVQTDLSKRPWKDL